MELNIVESPELMTAWAWVEKNRKQVILGVAVVAVVGFGIGYMSWARAAKEEAAGLALSQVLYNSSGSRVDGAATAEALLKIATDNSGTQAGTHALLLAGGALFNESNYPEAQATFERFAKEHASDPLASQAVYGAGAALEAQGKLTEAAQAYKNAVDRFPTAPIAQQARYSLAGVYAAQSNLEQAVTLYEEVAQSSGGNSLGNEAAARSEELHAKLPPVKTMQTTAPAAVNTNVPPAQP